MIIGIGTGGGGGGGGGAVGALAPTSCRCGGGGGGGEEYTLHNLQFVSSLLQPRNSGLPIPGPNFSLADAKMGVVFTKCGRGPKISRALISYAPTTSNIFLRLW